MNFDRNWTIFALDAEVEAFGTSRIASAHNKLRAEVAKVSKLWEEERNVSDALEMQNIRLRELLREARPALDCEERACGECYDIKKKIDAAIGGEGKS